MMAVHVINFITDLIGLEIVNVSMSVADCTLVVLSFWNLSKLYT